MKAVLTAIITIFYLPSFAVIAFLIFWMKLCHNRVERNGRISVAHWRMFWTLYKWLVKFVGLAELEKQRREVMGKIYGVKADQEHEYILKDQRGDAPEEQIKFKVRFLNSIEYAEIQNDLYQVHGTGDERQERIVTGSQALETLTLGLLGWENFTFEDGTEIQFKVPEGPVEQKRRIMLGNIDRIPPKYRLELAEHIRGESTLGEAE